MQKKFMRLTQSDAAYTNALEHHKRIIAVEILHEAISGFRVRLQCADLKSKQQQALSRLRAAIRSEIREEERISAVRVTDALVASRNHHIALLEAKLARAASEVRARDEALEQLQLDYERQQHDLRDANERKRKQACEDVSNIPEQADTSEQAVCPKPKYTEGEIIRIQAHLRCKAAQLHVRKRCEERWPELACQWEAMSRRRTAMKTLIHFEGEIASRLRLRMAQREEALTRERCVEAERLVQLAIFGAIQQERAALLAREQRRKSLVQLEQFVRGWGAERLVARRSEAACHERASRAANTICRFFRMVAAVRRRKRLQQSWMAELYKNRDYFAATKIQATWRMSVCRFENRAPLRAHSTALQQAALAEGRRLRQLALIPVIQRAYRCHMARRLAAYSSRCLNKARQEYVAKQMRNEAALTLQRFARIVRAKGILRRQRYVMGNILRYRDHQRARMLEEEVTGRMMRMAVTLLQRSARGALVRWALRRYRVHRVEEFERQSSPS